MKLSKWIVSLLGAAVLIPATSFASDGKAPDPREVQAAKRYRGGQTAGTQSAGGKTRSTGRDPRRDKSEGGVARKDGGRDRSSDGGVIRGAGSGSRSNVTKPPASGGGYKKQPVKRGDGDNAAQAQRAGKPTKQKKQKSSEAGKTAGELPLDPQRTSIPPGY
jgi:hypothetical protein